MEDKRVLKTKANIKSTLINMLQTQSFESITVTDLCKVGLISRITFYTYYEDKYDLIDEIFDRYVSETTDQFHALEKNTNLDKDSLIGYVNLLDSILNLYYSNIEFFRHVTAKENPYLYAQFFNHVQSHVDDYITRNNCLAAGLPVAQVSALICKGMFGVIDSCIYEGYDEDYVRKLSHEIYAGLLSSGLFITK